MEEIAFVKRNIFLISLILTSCSPKPSPVIPTVSSPSMGAFEFSSRCPHGCWLGINPGKTTADEANFILRASNQIDKQQYLANSNGIATSWQPENFNTATCSISVQFENGLVKSLFITNLPYTVNDFVGILGQPDPLRINVQKAIIDFVVYNIYFSSRRVMIEVDSAKWTGPDPDDTGTVWLNVEPDLSTSLVDWGSSQSWLGYGHIKDYLPGVEIPADIVTPTP